MPELTNQDVATGAGGVAGAAFGTALVSYIGDIFVYRTGLVDFPEMPELVVMGLGGALGAWLARWLYGPRRESRMFHPREPEKEE